jgi:hypothetical protein
MTALPSRLSVLALAAAAACVTSRPPYTFAPGEAQARVFLVGDGHVLLLENQRFYTAPAEPDSRYALIPATGPIGLGQLMRFGGYHVSTSCFPMVAFLPQPDASYAADASVIGDRCVLELVREDGTTRTGVRVEPTVRGLGD